MQMGEGRIPLVAVILPHFGCERYLSDAVSSILQQDLDDLSLLVVDDASSTDIWLNSLKPFFVDQRLALYRTSRNVGPYRIKNRLIRKIQSPYIAFQDADDVSHPQRLSRELRALDRSNAHIVGCSFNCISETGVLIQRRRMVENANLWMKFGKSFVALHPTTIVRREVFETLGGFDGTTHFAADADFFLRAAHLYRIRNVPECLYDYRVRSGSLSISPETGLGSERRTCYLAAMRKRELQRHGLRHSDNLAHLFANMPNDLDFDLRRINPLD